MQNAKNNRIQPPNAAQETSREPIAIIGIGCRFPGDANSPEAFWNVIKNGVNAITEIPGDRWDMLTHYDPDSSKSGKTYVRWGGFLKEIDKFDAAFFAISPREAGFMDPQQRLLLEVCYEALEDGGQPLEKVGGTKVGVFVGISTHDYSDIHVKDVYNGNSYTNSGGALSIAANRVSYSFNLLGPSMAVDTACSSSLVAVHLACRSIWDGESTMAIAGGVNCILTPEPTVGFSKANMLAPDGQCKTFDASANGYVRGEGAGALVLKPLSQAMADGDPIYAVIRSTGVNQDGHTHGLTVPSQEAQSALLEEVYGKAHIDPSQVLYVEAHGTGTPVGDPIECNAIGNVLGVGRTSENPLRVGSVKTNIGHLEAASGVAGLIKAAMVIKNRQLPPNRNFNEPNPRIPFDELHVKVQQELEAWPEDTKATVVGVNSFGFGGTNAHVVLDEAPVALPASATPTRAKYLMPLSAGSQDALKQFAGEFKDLINDPETSGQLTIADLAFTTSARRTQQEQRLAMTVSTRAEVSEQIEAYLEGESLAGMSTGRQISGRKPKLAFVFSGMGPQWWAMGRQMLENEPVFRQAVEEADALFTKYADWSLIDALLADQDHSRMEDTEVAQPTNFAIQLGLIALWRSWGIQPDAIIGHSAGEVAATYAAGILSLEDAVQVIYHRSRLQQLATGKGRMLAVGLSSSEALSELNGNADRVSVAAINSPRAVTLSGDADALEKIAKTLDERRVFARFMDVAVPYHSHHMDPLKAELLSTLASTEPHVSKLPYYSVVTGTLIEGTEVDEDYWWRNVRQPVEFSLALEKMLDEGFDAFVEVSPHPVLSRSIIEAQNDRGVKSPVLPSLRREADDRAIMLGSLGTLYTIGCALRWECINPGHRTDVKLPSYPWQRERHWDESETSRLYRFGDVVHPLLERRVDAARPGWETRIGGQRIAYLNDHKIQGAPVFPAAAYIEMALAASKEINGEGQFTIEDLEFKRAMTLQAEGLVVQIALDQPEGTFSINSHLRGTQSWALHSTGRVIRERNSRPSNAHVEIDKIQARAESELPGAECYEALSERGLMYGPRFQGIERLWIGNKEALGRLTFDSDATPDGARYRIHPSILDSSFQVLIGAVFMGSNAAKGTYLPVKIERLKLLKPATGSGFWAYAKLTKQSGSTLEGDFTIVDDDGDVVVEISGLKCQAIPDPRAANSEDLSDLLYELQWFPKSAAALAGSVRQAFVASPKQVMAALDQDSQLHDRREHYEDVEPQINQVCAAYVSEALKQMGWKPVKSRKVTTVTLAKTLGVGPDNESFLSHLLDILETAGVLTPEVTGWTVNEPLAEMDIVKTSRAIVEEHPDYADLMALLEQVGLKLATTLMGIGDLDMDFSFDDEEPAEAPAEESDDLDASTVLSESPYGAVYGRQVQAAVRAAAAALPGDRTLRVLEINAAKGGLAALMLPVLPRNRTEYVFTDTSAPSNAAKQKLGDYAFVDYLTLDIEKDPKEQGFVPHSFDLVIAGDALQSTFDRRGMLTNLKGLLASDGMLIALGATRIAPAQRLAAGPNVVARSLSGVEWQKALQDAGFCQTTTIADAEDAAMSHKTVLLARAPHLEQAGSVDGDAKPSAAVGRWLIFADQQGLGGMLAEQIESEGESAILVCQGSGFRQIDDSHFEIRPESTDDVAALLQAAMPGTPALRNIVHLWSLNAAMPANASLSDFNEATQAGSINVLQIVQSLAKAGGNNQSRLWVVTRGVQDVGLEAPTGVVQSAVWGLGRVIMNEHPHLRCSLIDLAPTPMSSDAATLLREFRADDVEQEVALRGGNRFVSRIVRPLEGSDESAKSPSKAKARVPFQMEVSKSGSLESLVLREKRRKKPAAGEVEIEVVAAGLNFRDVMKAMGLYPSEEGDPFWLGDECSGRVVRIGDGVTEFKVGDEVIAVAPGCFSSHVTISTLFVAKKPAHITFEEAAAIPIVFLTTHYSLNHVAKLSSEDRILIHSAAGGVGLSAIQMAKQVGAEIFATAGSNEKRDFLRNLGIKHVMDSRSLDFAEETMRITGGKGISVVLNSLAGDFIPKSISLLEPTGRFIELGKVDLYQNSKLGLYPFRSGLSFSSVDMGWLLGHRPQLSTTLLDELMVMFENKSLSPLPVKTMPIGDASKAFRFMAQAGHIGKIVLTLQEGKVDVLPAPPVKKPLFKTDATYMITGGLGGFGLAVAQWMVDQGAKNLMLVGRSGIANDDAAAAVAKMQKAGARVEVGKADIACESDVKRIVAEIDQSMPPLRGVFHGAVVFDDGYLLQLNESRFQRVMGPKADGAWNLHLATLNQQLDYFVMFSSLASWAGSVGQGNYAAANAFMDYLAQYRKAQKLPGLTINWGALAEVGYVARNPDIGKQLDRQGFPGLRPQEATAMLGKLLQGNSAEAGAIRVDFQSMASTFSAGAAHRRFSHLLQQMPADGGASKGARKGDFMETLKSLSAEEQQSKLEALLKREVSSVLGIPASRLDPEQDLSTVGLDSLMSVELEIALETELGADLPLGFFLGEEITLRNLSRRLREQIESEPSPEEGGGAELEVAAHSNGNGHSNGTNGNGLAESLPVAVTSR